MENPPSLASFSPCSFPDQAISTGSLHLDLALCTGGIQRGAMVEISGPECSGKTTLCQHIVAQAQTTGSLCAWIDADNSFEPNYASRCGVVLERLFFTEPAYTEQALDILEILAGSGVFTILVIDSLHSLVPLRELSGAVNGTPSEENSFLLSCSLRRLAGMLQRTGTSIIFTDLSGGQSGAIYHKLAGHSHRLALKLHAAQRLRLVATRELKSNHEIIGMRVQVKVLKNPITPCLHISYFDIINGQGINKSGEVLELGIRLKLIQKPERGYTFGSNLLGFSAQEAVRFLNQNISIRDYIEKAICQALKPDFNIAAT